MSSRTNRGAGLELAKRPTIASRLEITDDRIAQRVNTIPSYRQKLLWFSGSRPPKECKCRGTFISVSYDGIGTRIINKRQLDGSKQIPNDPSTIYFQLPVEPPSENEAKLPYGPCYRCSLDPNQRGKYLNWLCEIEKPIEIGYVFLYYYGLERHLLFDNFDAAFEEILLLRKFHSHASFSRYSEMALVQGSLLRDRGEKLPSLLEELKLGSENRPVNEHLIYLYYNDKDLSVPVLMKLATEERGINPYTRYLKNDVGVFKEVLTELLVERFGCEYYPFRQRFNIESIKRELYSQELAFANISLPIEVRRIIVPYFPFYEPFQEELSGFFKEVHLRVKLKKRNLRYHTRY